MVSAEVDNDGPYCGKCGAELDWEECEACGGEGEHDVYDSDPLWYLPGETEQCDLCEGHGGEYWCPSCGTVEWQQVKR